jgi:RNA polymerase sigma factor (sigma-70 family)
METQINEVVDFLRRAALRQSDGGLTDGQLLARFIEQREQAAVAALVQRHGPMVWGVCRRMLRNHHDAEDAFQASFLVLVRKAASIRQREMMANWLFGVAHQTAMKARAMIAKRRTREKQGTAMPEPQATEQDSRNDLQPLLDQELSRLPDKYRVAIVLCDLEGKTRREAARQLGLPEGTLAGRLTRGKAMLARRLARRGLAVSGGTLAAVFAQEATSAGVPISVVASTIKAASMFAAGQAAVTGAISAHVTALTEGVLKAMLLAKMRIPLTLVLALALALAGTDALHRFVPTQAAEAQPSPKRDQPVAGGQAAASPKPGAAKTAAGGQKFLNDALKEFEAAANEPGEELRHRLLANMAALQAQLGDREAAKKLFAQANDMVAALDESQQSMEWHFVATTAARAGEVDEAIAVALRIPKGKQDRDYAFQQVATALARQRLEKEARRVAAMVEDEEMKSGLGATLLEELALADAWAGNIPEALRGVERMNDPSSQVTALLGRIRLNMTYDYPVDPSAWGVARLQAKAGDKALARKTLQRAADVIASMPDDTTPRRRARALTQLACAQARLGEFATARKTVEKIQHETGKAIALATLVRQLAQAGRVKEAMTEIDALPVGTTKVHVLTHLGAGQAEAGDRNAARTSFRQAHLLIEKLQREEDRLSQGGILATVRAEAGDYKGAIQTAQTYNPTYTLGYANIAFAQAKVGDFTGALEIAEKLNNRQPRLNPDWWKLRILEATASLQALRGESKSALEWIDRLDSHFARAWALMGIAEGLTATKPPGKK